MFLSYRRNEYYERFFARLKEHLEGTVFQQLGGKVRECKVFRDTDSSGMGNVLDERVADALASSAVLVALFAPAYYGPESPYTRAELDHMLWRWESTRRQSPSAEPLVFPFVMDPWDYADLPEPARKLIREDLSQFVDPNLKPDTQMDSDLARLVRKCAQDIAKAVLAAPAPAPEWADDARQKLKQAWNEREKADRRQRDRLGFGGARS